MQEENNEDDAKEEVPIKEAKKKKSKKIKKSTTKKIYLIIILIVILGVVLYFAFKTLRPEKVVATVNNEAITTQELEQKYTQLPDQYKMFITKEDFLDQIINVNLLLQEAKKEGIVVSEGEIENELENLKKQVPTEEEFEQLLEQRNLQISDLKKQISEQLAINSLLNETVFSKIDVSESKISEYYDTHKNDFKAKADEIKVRHILVSTEEEAKELLKQLQQGMDFSELAKLKSIDAVSAKNGGDLGFIGKGQMVK